MRLFCLQHILGLPAPLALMLLMANAAATQNITANISSPGVAPQTTTASSHPVPSGDYVFTIVNSHTAPVSTKHAQGAGSPTAIRNTNESSIIAPSQTVTFAVPTGWSGRMAMWEDGYVVADRASLLEGSFMPNPAEPAILALDVSYVDGFTVPMVCECNHAVVAGCNLNLHDVCPEELRPNNKTCANPYRDTPPPRDEENIFVSCKGMAYTYPIDDLATKVNIAGCERNITCCIGTACRSNPGQLLCPATNGTARGCGEMGIDR
ncbi:uncharacterized protein GGS25DRAFT_213034 [Hypoxylon fragiforme]|uniref:uncharacterized protein n=1 Tax=Hypoxylon fragiforme TaxID=63214 RepID=UPI0020C6CE35|nr:uncharacterized protein GGS25DRAFT_213034 [Hypoxylon fragiforme]KAI2609381.1 hypothetical protein GGS25DRAFT_213034 [Hypoxylon fragiforme]